MREYTLAMRVKYSRCASLIGDCREIRISRVQIEGDSVVRWKKKKRREKRNVDFKSVIIYTRDRARIDVIRYSIISDVAAPRYAYRICIRDSTQGRFALIKSRSKYPILLIYTKIHFPPH